MNCWKQINSPLDPVHSQLNGSSCFAAIKLPFRKHHGFSSSNATETKKQCNTLMSKVRFVNLDYLWFLYDRWHVCPSCRIKKFLHLTCWWCRRSCPTQSNAVLNLKLYPFSWHGIYCQPIERVGEEWSHKSSQHTICSDFFPALLFHHLLQRLTLLTHECQLLFTNIWSLKVPVFLQSRQLCYVHTWEGASKVSI